MTGRRALQAAPRGRVVLRVAQVGLEPTASLVLSQGGLPIAYRAVVELRQYPEQESNPQTSGFKPDRSASWRIWASSSPGWTRTTDSVLVRELPSPLGHRTMNFRFKAEAARLALRKRLAPPPVFKTGSSSGRMTSVELRGLESNQHQGVQSAPSCR